MRRSDETSTKGGRSWLDEVTQEHEERAEGPKGDCTRPYSVGSLLLAGPATISVETAGKYLGIGRAAAYECVRNGEIPVLHLGRRLLVPVPALMKMLFGETNDWAGARRNEVSLDDTYDD